MMKCDEQSCQGHRGKFESCLAEALYTLTMEGGGESTGESVFRGHFTLIHQEEGDRYTFDEPQLSAYVPAGWYIVACWESGAVSLWIYETQEAAEAIFQRESDLYDRWMNWDQTL